MHYSPRISDNSIRYFQIAICSIYFTLIERQILSCRRETEMDKWKKYVYKQLNIWDVDTYLHNMNVSFTGAREIIIEE